MSDPTEEDLRKAREFLDSPAVPRSVWQRSMQAEVALAAFRAEARREATEYWPSVTKEIELAARQSEREACERIVGDVRRIFYPEPSDEGSAVQLVCDEILCRLRERAK